MEVKHADDELPKTHDREKAGLARKILGVPDNATIKEIKKRFFLLAMENHPDKNPHNRKLQKIFQNMMNAYEYLVRSGDEKIDLFDPDVPIEEQKIGDYHSDNSWGYYLWWRDNFM